MPCACRHAWLMPNVNKSESRYAARSQAGASHSKTSVQQKVKCALATPAAAAPDVSCCTLLLRAYTDKHTVRLPTGYGTITTVCPAEFGCLVAVLVLMLLIRFGLVMAQPRLVDILAAALAPGLPLPVPRMPPLLQTLAAFHQSLLPHRNCRPQHHCHLLSLHSPALLRLPLALRPPQTSIP